MQVAARGVSRGSRDSNLLSHTDPITYTDEHSAISDVGVSGADAAAVINPNQVSV